MNERLSRGLGLLVAIALCGYGLAVFHTAAGATEHAGPPVPVAAPLAIAPRMVVDARRAASGTDIYAIDAGGSGVDGWTADEDYRAAGSWTYAVDKPIVTAGIAGAAPQAVYQSSRAGAIAYTLPNLTPGTSYTLRLHFAEIFFTVPGKRVFNVAVNGKTVLGKLDIVAAAGGAFRAIVESVDATANSDGKIVITFTAVTNYPLVNGIEVAGVGATPAPTPTPTNAPASAQDNTTYHNNNLRTGWYAHETVLNATNVASSAFHKIGTLTTAGKSYSQPLYVTAQKLADGSTHNVLIVTDSTDVVHAFDADSLAALWRRDFKGVGVRQQLSTDTGCDDNWPNIGINGTPVIDRTRNRMYVVVPTSESGVAHLRLHAISLANGNDAVAPVEVAASVALASGGTASVTPLYNFDRAGLLESGNTIYVPLSTHCDFDSRASHGWLLAFNPDTLARTGGTVNTTDGDDGTGSGVHFLGSIWESGFGIAADAQNNVYFATGNGPNDGDKDDLAMSVVKLPPNLNLAQRSFFTPSTWLAESQNDEDLGAGGVMLLPDQTTGPYVHLALAGGKSGRKYLLNRDNLGGLHATDQTLWEAITDGGLWGGPAYFVDPEGNQKILYGGSPSLGAYTLNTKSGYSLSLTSATVVGSLEHRNAGITPIVSSNGTQAGSAVVWAIDTPAGNNTTIPVTLYAFNAAKLSNTLFRGLAGRWTVNGDTGGVLITPLVANGRVYLATDGEVTVFGIH